METVVPKSTEKDLRPNKETVLRDFVRFSWRATRGLTTAAEAEGRELVSRMVDIGRVTPEEGDRLLKTLEWRMQNSRETFEKRVEASVDRAVERLGEISKRELSTLQGYADQLEQRLDVLLNKKTGK